MKNLHDIIQKNMETFEKTFPSIKDVAEKVGDTYGFPIYIQLKDFLLSSQLSIIQAIDEMIDEVIKNKEQVNGFQPYTTGNEEFERKVFFDGFDDGRNMMKIDLMKIRSFLDEAIIKEIKIQIK